MNHVIQLLGGETIDFMGDPAYFRSVYVVSDVWQNLGFNSIIYISALASISPELHEAAMVDGASVWKRIWHIDVPGIMPTISVMLILKMGTVFTIGFDKVFLMQRTTNQSVSEVISTYVYKMSIAANLPNFSFGAAIDLFQSVIGLILLLLVNYISGKLSGNCLW